MNTIIHSHTHTHAHPPNSPLTPPTHTPLTPPHTHPHTRNDNACTCVNCCDLTRKQKRWILQHQYNLRMLTATCVCLYTLYIRTVGSQIYASKIFCECFIIKYYAFLFMRFDRFFQRTAVSILCSTSSLDPRLKRLCKPSSSFHQLVSAAC